MQVSEPGGKANVCLLWEAFCGDVETQSYISWQVSVKATQKIMPFDHIIRAAAQQEQYDLHMSSDNAQKGFLGTCIN
ncbi:hypothetical protein N7471_002226 [Penicillium samsonianum]|uniref:uncharacterized protein n=1 Tax=Penicillium samsonianum TaxID=1882272 RepID=UPI0025478C45|nr:uncharacterized protein N7471_002226 [Penicillium samsonianum]KAJ6142773.1 hypothetical protein N7471_002226 [Penicillium samsonianum]